MHVQKTFVHSPMTLVHGTFRVRETVHVCAAKCRYPGGALVTRRAGSLREQLMPDCRVGYDVMVSVGLERFRYHRQREEIRGGLEREHNIVLSTGEISSLAVRFLKYLQALHLARAKQLRSAFAEDGGWPLHVDATGEDGRGTLLLAYAGWRGWVLGAWKIPTERAEAILPCLREVVRHFGAPCAVVRDLGRAMTPAVAGLIAELDLDLPVLACHYHFLQDVGTDLLKSGHHELRELFRRFKVRPKLRALARELGRSLGAAIAAARTAVSAWQAQEGTEPVLPAGEAGLAVVRALAQWVLDYPRDASGEDFPFDRPYLDLYHRCGQADRAAKAYLRKPPAERQLRHALTRLQRLLEPVVSEVPFTKVAERLRARAQLFDELRDTLRLLPSSAEATHPAAPGPLPPEQAAAQLQDIREAVEQLQTSLRQRRPARGPAQHVRQAIDLILDHLDRHGHTLWGHAIYLPEQVGGGIRLVERTNNVLETFFSRMKHDERRRSGRKILTHDFERLPPAAALVRNLNSPEYVALLCGDLEHLPHAFAQLDADKLQMHLAAAPQTPIGQLNSLTQVASASLPAADRAIVRSEAMQRRVAAAARSRGPRVSAEKAMVNCSAVVAISWPNGWAWPPASSRAPAMRCSPQVRSPAPVRLRHRRPFAPPRSEAPTSPSTAAESSRPS